MLPALLMTPSHGNPRTLRSTPNPLHQIPPAQHPGSRWGSWEVMSSPLAHGPSPQRQISPIGQCSGAVDPLDGLDCAWAIMGRAFAPQARTWRPWPPFALQPMAGGVVGTP
mmetsp:Transcript_74945/g.132354  ORF Transcript_74945/g.132354 Transcript_74945/m.132354 type:complete len:111 (-) Transcript_74945:179-511(-)